MATAVTVTNLGLQTKLATWNLVSSENGDAVQLFGFSDKTVIVTGTFDTATITVQASNDGTNWVTAEDTAGSAATLTAAGTVTLSTNSRYTRVISGAGAGGVAVTATLLANR